MQSGGEPAVKLLEHWIGQPMGQNGAPLEQRLAAWQKWYAGMFPNELPAELPKESQPNKWSYDELASFLESPDGQTGSPVARRRNLPHRAVRKLPPLQRARRRHRPRPHHASTSASSARKFWSRSSIRTRSSPTSMPARS